MHYRNFRYLDFWFWLAMCCVMPKSGAAVSRFTESSTMLKRGPFSQRVVVLCCCAGRVEP